MRCWGRGILNKGFLFNIGCLGVWVFGCLGVWVFGCLGVWVFGGFVWVVVKWGVESPGGIRGSAEDVYRV